MVSFSNRWVYLAVFGAIAMAAIGDHSQASAAESPPSTAEDIEFFERRIRPLLVEKCFECHSARSKQPAGNLRLDGRGHVLAGGDLGPAAVPGVPGNSLLIRAVGYGDTELQMPPDGRLPDGEIQLLTQWVRRGLSFPGPVAPSKAGPRQVDIERGREFWSFQPLGSTPLPISGTTEWPLRRLDHFVLDGLDRHGLSPSAAADKLVLLRRVTFDLIGLPPTSAEIDAYLADDSPKAYERLVDHLLASPHYGERWARHWLDLARYTDTTASWLTSTGQAWRYRDWVVRALNEDMPYDRFASLQLAGDAISDASIKDQAALGFLGLSPTYWKELRLAPTVIEAVVAEEWEERINTVCRTFLGLTVACARCHDHKFDPITMQDYYGLAGVFASTRLTDVALISPSAVQHVGQVKRQVAEIEAEIKRLKTAHEQAAAEQAAAIQVQIDDLARRQRELIAATPFYQVPMAHAVDDAAIFVMPAGPDQTKIEFRADQARDVALQIRGNPAHTGAVIPRRFPRVLSPPEGRPLTHGSGRLDLANAIFTDAADLAARVLVNRIWTWHFGRGLVTTPSNFGFQGDLPTHPALLDELARRFVAHGWSLKWLHREICLSATYRQASDYDAAKHAVDPENRWLWRMNRRRLEFEAWRDAMLLVSGELDMHLTGPSLALGDSANRRRTLYSSIERRELNPLLRLYDFPDPTAHSPLREITTTPLQQLFVLNGDPILRAARGLAVEFEQDPGPVASRVAQVYRRLFTRDASGAELELAQRYLNDGTIDQWTDYAHAVLGSNEFLFVD